MDITFIDVLVATLNLILGLFVYSRIKGDSIKLSVRKSFVFLTLFVAIWSLSLYFYAHPIIFSPLFWIKITYFVGVFLMGFSLFYFSHVFPEDSRMMPLKNFLAWLIVTLPFLYFLFFTDLWVREIVIKPWGYETVLGPMYLPVSMYSVFIIVWVIYNFLRKYFLTTDKIIRSQIKYVLLGIFLFTITVSFIDVFVPLIFKTSKFFALSPISSFFLVGFFSLAITRHHLFGIKVMLTEILVVFMGLILLTSIFLMPTVLLKILSVFVFFLFIVFGYLFIKITLTETQRREEIEKISKELIEAKTKSETLLAGIGEAVFAINKMKEIIHFNHQAEILTGYKASEVIGKTYYLFLPFINEKDRNRNITFIESALKEGKITEMTNDNLLITKDASELPVKSSASPLKNVTGEIIGALIVFRDVTKERKMRHLESEFTSLVTHEIKSPVAVINGYLGMLAEGTEDKLTRKQKKFINEARTASNRLSQLIRELLDISRIERGGTKIEPVLINPLDLVEQILTKEMLQLFKQKKQKFIFKKPDGLPKVEVDPNFIIVPIQNILSNASKYTPEMGRIELRIYQGFRGIIFRITDSGMGIPKEEQNRVFERFFRASNTTRLEKGTGLGLYLAKLMIELSDGKIWFKSEENKGTTFFCALPIAEY